jgi:hypothetical protein
MSELSDQDKLTRDNLIKVVREEGIPRCFDSRKQYADWLEAERSAPTDPFRRNICDDCTRSYKMQMVAQRRCVNRHQPVKEDMLNENTSI